jgi:ABC-type transporter Mla subunit MlaD
MASKANYFKIGLFVIASIVIIVAFTIILGMGSWGKKQVRFETYIDESVQGLSVGSPVKHRGVEIGNVEEITFVTSKYDLEGDFVKYSRYVMVIIAADYNKFGTSAYGHDNDMLNKLIEKGLRVRLTTQALTGISYIEVDYFDPDEYPPLQFPWEPKYKYIPSAPSVFNTFTQSIDQTLKKLEHVDFATISKNLNQLIVSLNKTLEGVDAEAFNSEMFSLIDNLKATSADLKDVINKGSKALDDANIKVLSTKFEELLDSLNATAANANEAITGFKDTNTLVQEMLEPQSPTRTTIPELTRSVEELLAEINGLVGENRGSIERILYKLDNVSTNLMEFSKDIKQDPGILIFSEQPAPSEVVK